MGILDRIVVPEVHVQEGVVLPSFRFEISIVDRDVVVLASILLAELATVFAKAKAKERSACVLVRDVVWAEDRSVWGRSQP